ncbi:MAG: hypothetical protein H6718_06600 [Polyangiaceae bacterium]|nr:hypothetical protein [Polyangiaceae bacterium]MCB9610060.1 hypothetical protein [Polyangiaceae bacterium]
MFGSLGRRSVEATVLLFAVLGFTYVPLGEHTGLEHAKAIFGTDAASRAGSELWGAVSRLRDRWLGDPRGHVPPPAPSGAAPEPNSATPEELLSKSAPAEAADLSDIPEADEGSGADAPTPEPQP